MARRKTPPPKPPTAPEPSVRSAGADEHDDLLGPAMSQARKCRADTPCDGPCISVRVKAGGSELPWAELRGYERNTLKNRQPEDLERLGSAILDRTGKGFAFPVFVWSGHRYVIDGAGRVPALEWLEQRGHVVPTRIPVALIEAESETEAAELVMLASSHHGDVTEDSVAKFAEAHRLQLDALGPLLRFQGVAIERALARQRELLGSQGGGSPGLGDPDAIPLPEKKITTRPGDLWLMGDHRLLCGDSTKAEDVARLMGDERADICITDPPYGVGLAYDSIEDTEAALVRLIAGWLPIARQVAPVVIFTPGVERSWLYPRPSWAMAWFYGGGPSTSAWGFSCWQPILCYGKDPSLASGRGRRPDAVDMNTPANLPDIEHPCPKPVAFWEWVFGRTVFERGAVVFDPFGGSGTTAIVAEKLGHSSMLMELSPAYCDVIVRRWEQFTGDRARRESDPIPERSALRAADELLG